MSAGPRCGSASDEGAAEVLVDGRVWFAVSPSEQPTSSAAPTTAAAAPPTSPLAALPKPPHRKRPRRLRRSATHRVPRRRYLWKLVLCMPGAGRALASAREVRAGPPGSPHAEREQRRRLRREPTQHRRQARPVDRDATGGRRTVADVQEEG